MASGKIVPTQDGQSTKLLKKIMPPVLTMLWKIESASVSVIQVSCYLSTEVLSFFTLIDWSMAILQLLQWDWPLEGLLQATGTNKLKEKISQTSRCSLFLEAPQRVLGIFRRWLTLSSPIVPPPTWSIKCCAAATRQTSPKPNLCIFVSQLLTTWSWWTLWQWTRTKSTLSSSGQCLTRL